MGAVASSFDELEPPNKERRRISQISRFQRIGPPKMGPSSSKYQFSTIGRYENPIIDGNSGASFSLPVGVFIELRRSCSWGNFERTDVPTPVCVVFTSHFTVKAHPCETKTITNKEQHASYIYKFPFPILFRQVVPPPLSSIRFKTCERQNARRDARHRP